MENKTVKDAPAKEKKVFSTTMKTDIIQKFKAACAYKDQAMNEVLEELMNDYVEKNLVIPVQKVAPVEPFTIEDKGAREDKKE